MTKLCKKCGGAKQLQEFYVNRFNADGYFNVCKACRAEYGRNRAAIRRAARPTRLDQFMENVSPEPNSGCWLWTAGTNDKGYGLFSQNGRAGYAHRFSFEQHIGPVGNLHVLHKCDVPCCVNPGHLFLGTHKDNMADMARKQRHGLAKLTPEMVAELHRLRDGGATYVALAKISGVHRSNVTRALNIWRGAIPERRG